MPDHPCQLQLKWQKKGNKINFRMVSLLKTAVTYLLVFVKLGAYSPLE